MKPRIEPVQLSEARWSKIEDAMFERLDEATSPPHVGKLPTGRSPVLMFGVAASIAALAAGTLFMVARGTGERSYAYAPSRIVTGAEHSHLSLGESEIDVLGETAVVASGDDARGVLLVLEKGSVDCEVAPRKRRPAFIVQAGDTRVRVVGTKFRVTRTAAGEAEVSVEHGTVEVTRRGQTALVHDGEHWPLGQTAAEVPAPSSVSPVPVAAEKQDLQVPHALSDKQVYEHAAKHERSDPDAAISGYRTLAHGSGAWAANALFAWGRLALERGKKSEGERLLEQYLKRYPKGPNAADAKRLLGR
jgi:hypothetical protein